MANGFKIDTPRIAHDMAHAAGMDAANAQMRKAGRETWNRADYNLAASETQRWYGIFGILNPGQWMPEGYEWRKVRGDWRPMPKRRRVAA